MKSGAIAFLDILGFKGIWASKSEDEILPLLLDIPKVALARYTKPSDDWPKTQAPEVTVLSDTIVVTIESDSPLSLLLLCTIVCDIIVHLLKRQMFLRGAITWGAYTQSGPVFLGPAIDDAAAWHERADWIGVITTPKASYLIERMGNKQFTSNGVPVEPFLKYEVPLKNGQTVSLNTFNWPGFLNPTLSDKSKTLEDSLIGCFSVQAPFDLEVQRKYENTLAFVRHALKAAI